MPSIRVALSSLLFCVVSIVALVEAPLAASPPVVAQVGTVPITTFELARERQRLLPFNANFHGGIAQEKLDKIKEEALANLVERAYKVHFALDEKLPLDKKKVDEAYAAALGKFKSEKDFKKALGEEGPKEFRASLERKVLAEQAEAAAVTGKIKVDDAEIKAYYESNKQMYNRPRQFKASHILIKVAPTSNQEERAALESKAKDLARRARAGEDFYNLAYYNSDDRSKYVGGDLGYFHEGQTVREFEAALKQLKAGEVSDPVKSLYGWHIIKLVELNEPRQLEFEEVRDRIRQQVEKGLRDKLYAAWMEELKGKYPLKKF